MLCQETAVGGVHVLSSCQKMVLDPQSIQMFILGRYLKRGLRDTEANTRSDIFVYDILAKMWIMITDDTSVVRGPNLIFDHQV